MRPGQPSGKPCHQARGQPAMLRSFGQLIPYTVPYALFFLSRPRKKRVERWLRGREEFRKLQAADYILMSWGKSGRTWLRLMLSRFYQIKYALPETSFLQFDNLHAINPEIPRIFFTHGNYLRNYTGEWHNKSDFYAKKIAMLVRDPRDVAVSQYFQWNYRMVAWKKYLNDYPPDGADISLYDFVKDRDAGLPCIIDFFNIWARELPKVQDYVVLRYEDMRADPETALDSLLRFMGTPGTEDQIRKAVAFASYDNMKKLETKKPFWLSGRRLVPGDRKNPDSYKVRRAKVGGYRDYFDEQQIAEIDGMLRASMSPFFGYGTQDGAGLREDANPQAKAGSIR
jgi:hypothetical protein